MQRIGKYLGYGIGRAGWSEVVRSNFANLLLLLVFDRAGLPTTLPTNIQIIEEVLAIQYIIT